VAGGLKGPAGRSCYATAVTSRPGFHNRQLETLRLPDRWGTTHVDAIDEALHRRRALQFVPLSTGLFPASSAANSGDSGYGNVWVRDNVYVAFALLESGRTQAAAAVATALLRFYSKYRRRFEAIVSGVVDPDDVMRRPHVRFDGATMTEVAGERWSHAQNDALGYFLWLCARLARQQVLRLDRPAVETLFLLTRYVKALKFWEDEDSGHWEETRKISASSIGVVVAGLREWRAALGDRRATIAAPGLRDRALRLTSALLDAGRRALDAILPNECVQPSPLQNRRYDAALIFLVYPLEVAGERGELLLSDVSRYLQGAIGIRRYLRDSYWAPDYERLPAVDRTRDYSDDISVRDVLLEHVGDEAQWCIFDSMLSAGYGRLFLARRRDDDRRAQAFYFNRALAHVTADWKCPELYYRRRGRWVPNPHTPLQWTQANLLLALCALRATAQSVRVTRRDVRR
jgi:GH15 family glucan-1,4-alpha-glucosidase